MFLLIILRKLVSKGTILEVNGIGPDGVTALGIAYNKSHTDVYDELMKHESIDVNAGEMNIVLLAYFKGMEIPNSDKISQKAPAYLYLGSISAPKSF